MRSVLAVLVATAVVSAAASDALASCPRNGGTLCNVPGNVSQVAATWYTINATNPSGPDNYATVMHVVWADDRNVATSGSDLFMNYYASCLDSAGGQTGVPVVTAPGEQSSPVIVQSGLRDRFFPGDNFGVIVAWVDRRGIDADIYARRFYGAPPHPTWDATEIPICNAEGDQTSPVMVGSERGGAILGWVDGRSSPLQVYAQLVDSAGIGLWGANGIPVSPAAGDQELLQAATDGAGGAYFCWLDHRSGSALYAVRLTHDGLPASGWNADGNLVADGVQLSSGPRVIVDAGGLAVSWTDAREDPDGDAFVQRLGPDGSIVGGWPAGGNAVAAGAGSQRMDDFVSDDAGGCYVVWESEPVGGGDVDLYATRLDAGGAVVAGWPSGVCVRAGRQDHARACFTSGALFVIYSDDRSGGRDLYGSRLLPDGSVASPWPQSGIVVSNAPDVQDFPIIVPSPMLGTTHTAWIDYRDRAANGADLYGASIRSDGAVDVPRSTPNRLALGAPAPNPGRSGATLVLDLADAGRVDIDVLDCSGRHVRTLVSGMFPAGRHSVAWDGRTEGDRPSPPGVYFVRASIGNESLQRPLVVIR